MESIDDILKKKNKSILVINEEKLREYDYILNEAKREAAIRRWDYLMWKVEIMYPKDKRVFIDLVHDDLGNIRAMYYNPKTKRYELDPIEKKKSLI